MIVPYNEINPDTLERLIESFIVREGTDYGDEEVNLATKVAQVKAQLAAGSIVVVYDEASESINIVPFRDMV